MVLDRITALLRDMGGRDNGFVKGYGRAGYLLVESDGAGRTMFLRSKKAAKAFCGKRKTAGAGCAERRYLLMFRFW